MSQFRAEERAIPTPDGRSATSTLRMVQSATFWPTMARNRRPAPRSLRTAMFSSRTPREGAKTPDVWPEKLIATPVGE